jgi:tryptophan-rich sensory protein
LAFEPTALFVAAGICLGMAALGSATTGSGLRTWYPTIHHPRFEPPLWGFALIGIVVYILDGVVLYRLLTVVDDRANQVVAITTLVVVMLYNELWNAVLFRLRSPLAAFIGLLGFLAPLGILEVVLFAYEPTSGWLMMIYVAWVLAYDVPWSYRLWRLNASDLSPR